MDHLAWRTSSRCAADRPQCVAVAIEKLDAGGALVHVRDTHQGDAGEVLTFTDDEWRAFVEGVRAGEFDLA